MGEPKISVVIPVWNGERYLRQTIDSILAQDLADFEVLDRRWLYGRNRRNSGRVFPGP
jgi:GT2 family glycosyltransferase